MRTEPIPWLIGKVLREGLEAILPKFNEAHDTNYTVPGDCGWPEVLWVNPTKG